MAKKLVKRLSGYWRRKASSWEVQARYYKQAAAIYQGRMATQTVLEDMRNDWLKSNHPEVYEEMLKEFPEDDEYDINQLALLP